MSFPILPSDSNPELFIELPGSKSESNRALILQALSKGSITIKGLSEADDTRLLNDAIASSEQRIYCGHAGTTLRFLLAYFSSIPSADKILYGSDRLNERPVKPLVDALRSLGADITYFEKEGYPPLHIRGAKLGSKTQISLPANISSQFISALMLIAPSVKNGVDIHLNTNLVSGPYVEMSLSMMKAAGISCSFKSDHIRIPEQQIKAHIIEIEKDWSAASYWYALIALGLGHTISIRGLHKNSMQGDQVVATLMENLGVSTTYRNGLISLHRTGTQQKEMKIDFTTCPDLAQTVIVCAAALRVPSVFSGLETLRIKETDRITALQNELTKIGVTMAEYETGYFRLEFAMPPGHDEVIRINTYNDHRMAMSFAPLLLIWKNITIEDPDVVSKSYPGFWKELRKAGLGHQPEIS